MSFDLHIYRIVRRARRDFVRDPKKTMRKEVTKFNTVMYYVNKKKEKRKKEKEKYNSLITLVRVSTSEYFARLYLITYVRRR